MSLTNIIKKIEGAKITDLQGGRSVVFEIFPQDCEQMTEEMFSSWKSSLITCLNQLPIPEEKTVSGLQKLLGMKEEKSHWYKFYSIGERLFLNTTNEQMSLPLCQLKEVTDAFTELLGAEDFYSDVVVQEDFLHFNSTYFRMVNLYEMPKSLNHFDLQQLGDLLISFRKIHPDMAKRNINTQRKLHHANLYKNIRNLESEASYSEAEKMTEAMMMGEELMFDAEGWFLVKAPSIEELNKRTQILISELKQRDIVFLIESVSLSSIFPSVIFGIEPLFKRSHECPTSYTAALLPLKKDSLMANGYEFTTVDGNEVPFTLFNPESLNFNALFTGVSGTGKSMAAQKVVNEEIARGAKAIILDLGNSFDKMARYHKANIFSQKFNPLQFKDAVYLKEFVTSVIPEKELSAKLEGKIFKVIQDSLETVSNFRELVDKLELEIPEISLYFSELWDYFTDEDVKITSLTYVNTTDFPDKIKAPLIIYLIAYFKRLEGKKIFVFDEVWSFLRKNATYIEESFRTFRKEYAAAVAISQSLSEFMVSDLGRIIADLSYYKFIFSQNTEGISGLSEFDQERIKSVQSRKGYYSEFYLKSEHIRKILRFYSTPKEYVLFNTEPPEKIELVKFFEVYGPFFDYANVIERFVDFKYQNLGVNHA
ncbi:MAG: VirB4 family type IV secretion system protein [Bacteriovoracia bacterium]